MAAAVATGGAGGQRLEAMVVMRRCLQQERQVQTPLLPLVWGQRDSSNGSSSSSGQAVLAAVVGVAAVLEAAHGLVVLLGSSSSSRRRRWLPCH